MATQPSSSSGGQARLVTGHGTIAVRDAQETALDLTSGHGAITVERSTVRSLRIKTGLGDVEVARTTRLGDGEHDVKSGLGDIRLAFGPEVNARIDAATGWGEIQSDFPLVRVGRPGPAIFGGQRQVGTIGSGPAAVELKLRTGKGDIVLRRAVEAPAPSPTPPPAPTPAPAPAPARPAGDPRLAILQALQRGEITVEEAERRLREIPT